MKKPLCIALAALMILSLASCGKKEDAEQGIDYLVLLKLPALKPKRL